MAAHSTSADQYQRVAANATVSNPSSSRAAREAGPCLTGRQALEATCHYPLSCGPAGQGPVVVLVVAFGVELEATARTASEGVAQLVTGPEGNSPLGLVQERG